MSLKALFALEILKAELAEVNDGLRRELLGVGREVPRLHPVAAQLNNADVLHPSDDIIGAVAGPAAGGLLQAPGGRGRGHWAALS